MKAAFLAVIGVLIALASLAAAQDPKAIGSALLVPTQDATEIKIDAPVDVEAAVVIGGGQPPAWVEGHWCQRYVSTIHPNQFCAMCSSCLSGAPMWFCSTCLDRFCIPYIMNYWGCA